MIDRLYYITQDHKEFSHSELFEQACQSGVKTLQLRMKNASNEKFLKEAKECKTIANAFGAQLIINDNLDIALAVQADGVHLGLEDLTVAEAKAQAPKDFIIGGTANTVEQAKKHLDEGADYVGMGPFRFTTTKQKLSPILGIKGYQEAIATLNEQGYDKAVIAIGGVLEADFTDIMQTGVYGIAVSGLITNEEKKASLVERLKNKLNDAEA